MGGTYETNSNSKMMKSNNENPSSLLKHAEKIIFKEDAKSICDKLDVLFE
jgi:hypothetical protein